MRTSCTIKGSGTKNNLTIQWLGTKNSLPPSAGCATKTKTMLFLTQILVLVFWFSNGQPRPIRSSFQPNVPIFCVILRWKFFLSFLESWGVSLRIKVPPKIHKSSTEDPQKLHRRSTKVPQKNLLSPKGLFYMSIPSKVNVFTHDGTGRCLLLAC